MPYTTNKHMPRIRREAVTLVRKGWSARKVGRYLGYHHTAVMKWVKRSEEIGYRPIPTRSSRPRSHLKKLAKDVVRKIVKKRLEHNRYAEAVHRELLNDGVTVSLSSVKRTLERHYLIKKRSHGNDTILTKTAHMPLKQEI
jgi:transposase